MLVPLSRNLVIRFLYLCLLRKIPSTTPHSLLPISTFFLTKLLNPLSLSMLFLKIRTSSESFILKVSLCLFGNHSLLLPHAVHFPPKLFNLSQNFHIFFPRWQLAYTLPKKFLTTPTLQSFSQYIYIYIYIMISVTPNPHGYHSLSSNSIFFLFNSNTTYSHNA